MFPASYQFEIVCHVELGEQQVYNHLMPLALHPNVSKIWLVRSQPLKSCRLPKSEHLSVASRFKLVRLLRGLACCLWLAAARRNCVFVSFNPIPYGLIGMVAALAFGRPYHLGFIGTDWHSDMTRFPWKLLSAFFRRAPFVTATGPAMLAQMRRRGCVTSNGDVLPHAIDLSRFAPSPQRRASNRQCAFVGRLIRLKRVDIIIRGFASVVAEHPDSRLAIIGDGPCRDELESLANELGISANVDFLGHRNDEEVAACLQDSTALVVASQSEGLPFALVEAISCGCVPICTPAGSIPDVIVDGQNGLLFPMNDHQVLGLRLKQVLGDADFAGRLREHSLKQRDQFAYRNATLVWHRWLSGIAEANGVRLGPLDSDQHQDELRLPGRTTVCLSKKLSA